MMRSFLTLHVLSRILSKRRIISAINLTGVSAALVLVLVDACAGPASSASPTTALSITPLPTVAGIPSKKEEIETSTPAEESVESAPVPNPLAPVAPGGDQTFAPVPGADITKNGAAASLHGSPARGQTVFAQNCQACYAVAGKGGLANKGSDDGTVPPLNPIDPGFKVSAKGDPAAFAREIDLFIQHGSRPSGPDPALSMIAWGDHHRLTQQQIADVEAYVMQLNGISWPSQ